MPNQTAGSSLLARLLVSQPMGELRSIRSELVRDLSAARDEAKRLEADLQLIDTEIAARNGQLEPLFKIEEPASLPLRRAIIYILDRDPRRIWRREELLEELDVKGWGPGGENPRNTLTSRLRELEKEMLISRVGRDEFRSMRPEDEEVPAV